MLFVSQQLEHVMLFVSQQLEHVMLFVSQQLEHVMLFVSQQLQTRKQYETLRLYPTNIDISNTKIVIDL
jgi:hypothetical protein